MNDSALVVGVLGTGLSWSFANSIIGSIAGILTCIYMAWKLYRMWKDKHEV